jgi:hypothetical protein
LGYVRLWWIAEGITLTDAPFGIGTITGSPLLFTVRTVVSSTLRLGMRVDCDSRLLVFGAEMVLVKTHD